MAAAASAAEAVAEPEQGTTVREAIQELAEAGAKGAAKKRDATENDWVEFLGPLFGFLSMLLVWWLVVGKGWSKAQRQEFEFTDEEADALAGPAARIMSRSWVNMRFGKHILGASDYILLALVMFDYTDRITPLVRERMRDLRPRGNPSRGSARSTRREEPAPAPPPPTNNPTPEERNGLVAQSAEQQDSGGGWLGVYPANLT